MDRRTFIYVALMAISLFFVNSYFEYQHVEQLRIYNETKKMSEATQAKAEVLPLTVAPVKFDVVSSSKEEQKFYVLENNYQQLVFSNYGGALVELNLPFKSGTNPQSVVKEIEFDREMVHDHPYNAYFPAHPYYTPSQQVSEGGKLSLAQHEQGVLGGYYPLLRRPLIHSSPSKSVVIPPRFYGLNIISDYPEVAELVYEVKYFDQHTIVFEATQEHRRITKTFSVKSGLEEAPYTLTLSIKVEGDARGLWLTSGVPEVEWISGAAAPSLKYRLTRHHKSEVLPIDFPKENTTIISSVYPDWVSNSNGFLGLILDPLTEVNPGLKVQKVSGTAVPTRLVEIQEEFQTFKAADLPGYMTLIPLNEKGGNMEFRIFAGPFSDGILKTVDRVYSNAETNYNPDYVAAQTFHGWFAFISEPFAKFLFILMNF